MGKTFEALQRAEEEGRFRKLGPVREIVPVREMPPAGEMAPTRDNHFTGRLKVTPRTVIEHQRLKCNILRLSPSEDKVKALMFSSPTAREGTTSVLIDFANSLAHDGERLLLVDANLRRPSLHAAFGLAGENGLTDLLENKMTLMEVIKETCVPGISVVTCGCAHPNPFVNLHSGVMKPQVDAMRANADWVLFDSPPVTFFNDAATMAASFDGVILVVQAEKTHWEVAENARNWIVNGNGNVLGVVLNKRRYPIPDWIYKRV